MLFLKFDPEHPGCSFEQSAEVLFRSRGKLVIFHFLISLPGTSVDRMFVYFLKNRV